jgi:pyruvate dehydrogenase E2 component (dihydrolipoamide acetyltransferase)
VPDIGDFQDIPVIEILVSVGDTVEAEDPLLTLESDKATMDVPAPVAGTITELKVSVGDTVSMDDQLLVMESSEALEQSTPTVSPASEAAATAQPEPAGASAPGSETPANGNAMMVDSTAFLPRHPPELSPEVAEDSSIAPVHHPESDESREPDPRAPAPPARRARGSGRLPSLPGRRVGQFHATPSVRRFARELGVDLGNVEGSGRKGRILEEDVRRYVKETLTNAESKAAVPAGGGGAIPPIPAVDFSKFGAVEPRPLSRIKRLTGSTLHRAWLNVPLVTHFDEADITELEAFRQSLKGEAQSRGFRVTPLAFIMQALVHTLRAFPAFNASLSSDGEQLILKSYYNIGVAVDTPNGLIVPVIREVDKKGTFELAEALGEVSERARDGKLKPDDLQGGCMSIASLGGIGGSGFTPLVNPPEVAILGVARSQMAPIWDGSEFMPRLMLPLCLSYDHRVIDGAEAARFSAHLADVLSDIRKLLI